MSVSAAKEPLEFIPKQFVDRAKASIHLHLPLCSQRTFSALPRRVSNTDRCGYGKGVNCMELYGTSRLDQSCGTLGAPFASDTTILCADNPLSSTFQSLNSKLHFLASPNEVWYMLDASGTTQITVSSHTSLTCHIQHYASWHWILSNLMLRSSLLSSCSPRSRSAEWTPKCLAWGQNRIWVGLGILGYIWAFCRLVMQ